MEVFSIMAYFLLFLIMAIFIKWYVPVYKRNMRMEKLVAHIRGPFAFPFVGCIHIFFGSAPDILRIVNEEADKYNGVVKLWLGNNLVLYTNNAMDIHKVLKSEYALDKAEFLYKHLRKFSKEGLVFSKVESWRPHSKVLRPLFKHSYLNEYVSAFQKYSEQVLIDLDELNGEDKNTSFADVFHRNFLKVAFETLIKKDISDELRGQSFHECLNRIMDISEIRMAKLWLHFDFIFNLTNLSKELDSLILSLRNFNRNIMQGKKKISDNTSTEVCSSEGIIEILKNSLDCCDDDVLDEMIIITAAATHTTTPAIQFIMILLALHPDVQEKVYEEVLQVIGKNDNINYINIQDFKYLTMVIKESLRLFPSAPLLARQISKDIELNSFTLPAGSVFFLNVLDIHRNEKYWPNANSFIPERFSPENANKHDPYAYFPFSVGPRMCIGYKYAMMMLTIFVVNIVRKYKITTSYKSMDEIEIRCYVSINPIHGTKCKLEHRL